MTGVGMGVVSLGAGVSLFKSRGQQQGQQGRGSHRQRI